MVDAVVDVVTTTCDLTVVSARVVHGSDVADMARSKEACELLVRATHRLAMLLYPGSFGIPTDDGNAFWERLRNAALDRGSFLSEKQPVGVRTSTAAAS
ncbi:hypothetical protein [Fodinicola acaciae]|uniref:hypothetical protein n=1 Tax=Fodinicola acaciae TaxID=2681555 RepID=UPI0013CFFF8E|nr:hypothetical protein [Fodinicola acaciae]